MVLNSYTLGGQSGVHGNKTGVRAVYDASQPAPRRHYMPRVIEHDHSTDGVDRRGFLSCMAWTGTGLLWSLSGGVPASHALDRLNSLTETQRKSLFFAQIS